MTRLIKGWLFVTLATLMVLPAQARAGTTGTTRTPPPPPPAVAPVSLTATASNGKVSLSWDAVAGVDGYRIFRTTAGVWSPTPLGSISRPPYTNSGLANGTAYSYKVAAYNRGGTGPQSNEASATPMAPPAGVIAAAGDRQVTLTWQASAGALTYTVFRSQTTADDTLVAVATGLAALSFVDTGLTNGTTYYYRLRAFAAGGTSGLSSRVSAKPLPPPPASAPAALTAKPGNARVELAWSPVDTATGYRVYRTTTGTFDGVAIAKITGTTFKNTGLMNGTPYSYRVAAYNTGGTGPNSNVVTATPVAPPPAPSGLTAAPGDRTITLTWTAVPEATAYNIYRGTRPGRQAGTPIAIGVGLAAPSFVDSGLDNGPTLYYKVTATNAGGMSPRSDEASATPEGPALDVDAETQAAFRLLRQATWGARAGDVDHVKAIGVQAFLDEQFAQAASVYPSTLQNQPTEMAQEQFMQFALTGGDQLRQRVAWALHKIWVVSAVEVDSAPAILTYYQLLMDRAFGNYRDVMRDVTLNPAMGRYLNMLNNRSEQVTGVPPNENYPREIMQLFTLGTGKLNPNGTPILDGTGAPVPTYSEGDVKALARIFTGWTWGGSSTGKKRSPRENYRVPMQPIAANHDPTEKLFLGETFPAGQTATADLDQAIDVLFNHPNIAPFVSRQLIQQLVTSNPSPAYVASIAGVFSNNGAGVRGDLAAVVRAILTHPDAAAATPDSGKLSEPVLFVASMLRALGASVTDHPFMSDKAAEMGQKVFYPPSVFSYFSPGYRVRGTAGPTGAPLGGPEFRILTSVTSLVRANFAGDLLARRFGSDVTVDYSAFTSRARDAAGLVDYCNLVLMGGRMSPEARREIINAVRASSADSMSERTRTALYLTLVIAQSQVDR